MIDTLPVVVACPHCGFNHIVYVTVTAEHSGNIHVQAGGGGER